MTYDQLSKALKSNALSSVYVLYGQEVYVRERAVKSFRTKLLPEGLEQLNENIFDAAVSVPELIDAAETLPFMSDKRLVIVKNWAPLTSRGEAGDADRFVKWLEAVPDTCCLLFVQTDPPDTRKKLGQALKAHAEWVEFSPLDDVGLYKWCAHHLKEAGYGIEPDAMNRLVFMAGRDMTTLISELDKLCGYLGERTVITDDDVETIVTPSTECTVFQMIDCLMKKQNSRAQLLLKSMLENGETRIGVLAMLTRQLRMLTHIRLLRAGGVPAPDIERKLALNHYAASRALEQAGRFSAEGLEAGYKACVETDYAIKSGTIRESAGLDALMIRLGSMK